VPLRRASTATHLDRRTSTKDCGIAAVINAEKKKSTRIGDENPESATLNPDRPQFGRRQGRVAAINQAINHLLKRGLSQWLRVTQPPGSQQPPHQ